MPRLHKPQQRWHLVAKEPRFHHRAPKWRVVARATFQLVPDSSERLFIGGDNVRSAMCSLLGYGAIQFERPLYSPVLRAYAKDAFEPIQLLEVTQYGARFKTVEWPLDSHRVEEFIFEGQVMA
jgi:hypothetical protein